jgi:hypothetical protein
LPNGCFNGAALAGAGSSGLAAAGIGCDVLVIVACVASQVAALQKECARIMVRVAGIRWQQLAAVYAVEKPGHLDGTATGNFPFFDQAGAAALKVFLNFGGPISPEREARFIELRTRFKRR